VLTGVTETAAGDIESANFGGDSSEREDYDRCTQNHERAAIQKSEHKSERAQNFQPRKIKRQRDTALPWQDFVIVDVARKLNRVKCLKHAGVDEDAGENKFENSPKDV